MYAERQDKMDVEAALFTQKEVGDVIERDKVTLDTWLLRGILESTKVGGRILRGRRLFSVLAIFEAKLIDELMTRLAIPPSEAAKIAKCATSDWNAKDDWKPRIVQSVERSVRIASVYLLVKRRREGGWTTKVCYGDNDGPFKNEKGYEKWLGEAFGVLPVSLMFATVVKKCNEIQNRSGKPKTRGKK
jgi:hypothetical protein